MLAVEKFSSIFRLKATFSTPDSTVCTFQKVWKILLLIEKFVSNMIFGGFDVVSRRVSDKSKARRGACKVLNSRRLVILLDDIIDKPLRAL